jgi:hypothetical protein
MEDTGGTAETAQRFKLNDTHVRRLLRFGDLAPDIVEAIVEGRQPRALTVRRLLTEYNFQTPRRIGSTRFDHAFTDLERVGVRRINDGTFRPRHRHGVLALKNLGSRQHPGCRSEPPCRLENGKRVRPSCL